MGLGCEERMGRAIHYQGSTGLPKPPLPSLSDAEAPNREAPNLEAPNREAKRQIG